MNYVISKYLAAACAIAALAGCVVAPVGMEPAYGGSGYGGPEYGGGGQVYSGPGRGGPPVAVYIAPTYAMPGPGYAWQRHGRFGWGWYHTGRGWHRGWR